MSCVLLMTVLLGQVVLPLPAFSDHGLLKKFIISHNLETLEKSLVDGSYRGEGGILRIRPEIGRSFSMKVFTDQDYLEAKALYERADKFLEIAEEAMASQEEEEHPGEYAERIARSFLAYKSDIKSAQKRMMAYQSRLTSEIDDRLNKDICTVLLDTLLEGSLDKTENRLRDALGCFYNLCQGEDEHNPPLTPKNILFVNSVVHQFTKGASDEALKRFDLDRDKRYNSPLPSWKSAIGEGFSQYLLLLESALNKASKTIYAVDPLLFIALMKQESNLNPLAVSPVGAAGLTQIMPKTAKALGMRNIYMPEYFNRAVSLLRRGQKTREEAMAALFRISLENQIHESARARTLMLKSLAFGRESHNLFMKYKRELLRKRTDDRLQPANAIEYGLRYFALMMKRQGGDISLALASYNAGPNRVLKFQGIPPFAETVNFRNKVLSYYRQYLAKARGNS